MNPFARIGRFLRQVIDELSKTVTPTGRGLAGWTLAVTIFVLTLMLMVTGLDWLLGTLTLRLFG